MRKYPSILNVWKRDPETRYKTLIEGEWSMPEFGYLADCEWQFTEKVDGTNIRIGFEPQPGHIILGGRTDRAQLPAPLVENIMEHFIAVDTGELTELTLFGEGFGPGIQKGGGNYADKQGFILFDVLAGDDLWLQRGDVIDIAATLNLPVVPILRISDLHSAIEITRHGGWNSQVAQSLDFRPEGVVGRPVIELRTRTGERVICKIKPKDFAGGAA